MARIAIFLACFLLSASPAWAQAKSSIEKLNAEWMAAFNKGDAKALAAMYTPDAYVLPAGAEMAKGHNAIEKFWGGAVKQLGDAKLTTVDVQSLGPGAAREIGTFSFRQRRSRRSRSPANMSSCGERWAGSGSSPRTSGT